MSLKNKLCNILLCSGIMLTVLLFIQASAFIRAGYILFGLATFCIGMALPVYYLIRRHWLRRKLKEAIARHKRFLKTQGNVLQVDLSACKVYANKKTVYYDRSDVPAFSLDNRLHRPDDLFAPDLPEQSLNSQRANGFDALLFPDLASEQRSYERCTCIVEVTLPYKGKKVSFYSEPLLMNDISLEMFLATYKKSYIYINPDNDDDYFFDLDFITQA